MNQTPAQGKKPIRLQKIVNDYDQGLTTRERLFSSLKWEMALAQNSEVDSFLGELQTNQTLDADVLHEIISTFTENVQHWVFPESSQSYSELPRAISCTFPELVESTNLATSLLNHILNMLVGVNTRLNLRSAYERVGHALLLVGEEVELLKQAGELVGRGALLAPAFPRQEEKGDAWCTTHGAPLSPKQIVWLASLAQDNPEIALTYADGISHHTTPPQLFTGQARVKEHQRKRAEESRVLAEQQQSALTRTCPRCKSVPGEFCRSNTGRETSMHKGRHPVVP